MKEQNSAQAAALAQQNAAYHTSPVHGAPACAGNGAARKGTEAWNPHCYGQNYRTGDYTSADTNHSYGFRPKEDVSRR